MTRPALQRSMAWAEDRALLRSNPSADPGAKIGDGAANHRPTPFTPLRDWHESDKPSRHDAAILRHDVAFLLANTLPPEFQFPLNQDSLARFSSPPIALIALLITA